MVASPVFHCKLQSAYRYFRILGYSLLVHVHSSAPYSSPIKILISRFCFRVVHLRFCQVTIYGVD